jgi:serine protease
VEDSTRRTRRSRARLLTLGVLLAIVSGLLPVTASAADESGRPSKIAATPLSAQARVPAPKRAYTSLPAKESRDRIHLKFVEGSEVRLRSGRLVAAAGVDVAPVEKVLGGGASGTIARLFAVGEAELAEQARAAQRLSGMKQADMNNWYRVTLRPGVDAVAVLNALNALSVVETAYAEPLPAPLPAPNFQPQQGYLLPAASSGIDADYARTIPGGTGANVKVLDIEYAWNTAHEDLSKLRVTGTYVPNGTPVDPFIDNNHGTAVIGELSGDNNGTGVLGIVPDARIHITNASNAERGYDVGNSILVAAGPLSVGDVMLIEQQVFGPSGCGVPAGDNFVPVEWIPAYYDAIRVATGEGIIVVEAAGNGAQNLDNTCLYGAPFPSGRADSGAIMVGGSEAPGCADPTLVRSRWVDSTYGSRVDLQGWAECVTTTGWYGTLFGANPNEYYTADFGGTSGASPIVAGAAASLSSIAKQRGLLLKSQDVRTRLKNTGTAQQRPDLGLIGPLPNLRTAIPGLPAGNSTWTASASNTGSGFAASSARDGSLTTRWSLGVTQASGRYFQLNLGSPQTFNQLVLDTGGSATSQYPRGWAVRVSSDGVTWGSPIATGTGNNRVTTMNLPTTTARYVRVTLTTSSSSSWSIAEAYISPA